VWNNARTFNQTGSIIYEYADSLSKVCFNSTRLDFPHLLTLQTFEENYAVLKAKLNFPKSYDPPKPFVPPETSSLPVIPLPTTPPARYFR
jgi:hypothetical protein